MPVHNGHLALIQFAKQHCDELIVSMSYTPDDPILGELRFGWLQSIYANAPGIQLEKVIDDFDDESLPLEERTKRWAQFVSNRFPKIDIIISSEVYGDLFAKALGASHQIFDEARTTIPVSATVIRAYPFQYWSFIPQVVRPFFVKKICFYGPESTGKSTMAEKMAAYYHTEFVPEVARELLTSNDFTLVDIERVGTVLRERTQLKLETANKVLFCDTDFITTELYAQHYLGEFPSILSVWQKEITYDQYFFFEPDVPWVADGLRDLGDRREEMTRLFRAALEERKINYVTVKGNWEERFEIIKAHLDDLLADSKGI